MKFVLNKISLVLAIVSIISLGIYLIGYIEFNSIFNKLSSENELNQSMKWFILGAPILAILSSLTLFFLSSLDSRQLLLGVRKDVFLKTYFLLKLVYYNPFSFTCGFCFYFSLVGNKFSQL